MDPVCGKLTARGGSRSRDAGCAAHLQRHGAGRRRGRGSPGRRAPTARTPRSRRLFTPSLVQSILSSYTLTPAKGSRHSTPLQTSMGSGLDDCSRSVRSPDSLLPCRKEKKWGRGVLLESVGEKQKTTTGPDFVRIPEDDCEEMKEECEMNYRNRENALTVKSARAPLCGRVNKARKNRVVDLGGRTWPLGPRQQRVFSGHGRLSGGVVEEGRLAGSH